MGLKGVKKIFSIVSLKDFVFIYTGIFFNKLFRKKNFDSYYSALHSLIISYSEKDYDLKINDNSLQVSGVAEFKGFEFLIRPGTTDGLVFEQVIQNKEYGLLIELIEKSKPGSIRTIVDAGANVGFTTIFFRNHYKQAQIVCIEADHNNSLYLKRNILINKMENNVQILNKALWSNDEDVLLIKNDFRDGNSWSRQVSRQASGYVGIEEKVECVTMQTIAQNYGMSTIDILKIDIEGSEAELFKSTEFINFLAEKVKYLALEIHEEACTKTELESILTQNNFEILVDKETHFCINTRFKN